MEKVNIWFIDMLLIWSEKTYDSLNKAFCSKRMNSDFFCSNNKYIYTMHIVVISGSLESGASSAKSIQDLQTQSVCNQWPRYAPTRGGAGVHQGGWSRRHHHWNQHHEGSSRVHKALISVPFSNRNDGPLSYILLVNVYKNHIY